MRMDARLPVRFGVLADAREGDAVLLPAGAVPPAGRAVAVLDAGPGHPGGCACCPPRNAAAQALGTLFLRRAKGEGPLFRAVLAAVGPADAAAVRAALAEDALVAGRYRLAADA